LIPYEDPEKWKEIYSILDVRSTKYKVDEGGEVYDFSNLKNYI